MKISIGNDLVHIPRFEKSLALPAFLSKIFHEIEINYCQKKKDSSSSFAARFAVKESFSKALGTGLYAEGVSPKDVWIENAPSGKPMLCFSDKMQNLLRVRGIDGWDVSLSHHGEYAMAHVILMASEK